MSKYIKAIKKGELVTSDWSGGTTTQLYIYPEGSIYNKRDFKWRISSANVELNESEFTKLPNIKRKIMILDGKLLLEHKGHHNIKLNKFEQDSFLGDWNTRSFGKVIDFNLMLNIDSVGDIEHIQLNNCRELSYVSSNKEYYNIAQTLYCLNGNIKILVNNDEEVILNDKDLAVVKYKSKENLKIELININEVSSDIIRCIIYYK